MILPKISTNRFSDFLPYKNSMYASISNINFSSINSSFGIALHMHQPIIFSNSTDLKKSELISNLQYMLENPHIGDNHNAPIFLKCYSRISDIIRNLVEKGKNPRIMLDYSGDLLWGLQLMNRLDIIENLKLITSNKKFYPYVEWLGTMWSHAVVSSTPLKDLKLHMVAWRVHFASIFGKDAVKRVKGFSSPEMQLPIHPDLCYYYVKSLKECGYSWLLVQEHSIENLDGSPIQNPYVPYRLVVRNSLGKTEEITVLIKTKGSDTKIVAHMQPYYEAKTLNRSYYLDKKLPPFVVQISDGENGGVMMNDFPSVYIRVFEEISNNSTTVAMNGSEYLEFIEKEGVKEKDLLAVQPVFHNLIWKEVRKFSKKELNRAIEIVREKNPNFNLEKASWTNEKSWIRNYEDLLYYINKFSIEFHKKFDRIKNKDSKIYREVLLYLLISQTSDFRYWGKGIWTEYLKESCRRGMELLNK